jgi:hypothetical protein
MTIWNGLTSDGAVVPIQVDDQGRVIAVGSGPDSPLVVDGDYLRPRDPDLGLGTANINLDAAGSAEFAGGVTSQAKISSNRDTATLDCFSAGLNGNTNAIIRADGRVRLGGTVGSAPNIDLVPDGSAWFADTLTSGPIDLSAVDAAGCVMRPDGLLRLQREANKGGSAVMQVYNGKTVTTTLTANGKATFAGDVVTGTFDPSSNGAFGVELGVAGAVSAQRPADTSSSAILFRGLWGSAATTLITNKGDATFNGNVKAANIELFSVVLKAAVRNSTTLDELKTAIVDALNELVPPDVSTMPTPPTEPR